MGDEFTWNIAGMGILPANFAETTSYPWGFKGEAGLGLEYDPVFLEGTVEGSLHDIDASPFGVDHYDLTPPPNFTLSGGLAIDSQFYLRLGRHHYEKTQVEGLLTNRAFSVPANFANVTPDLGILGGETLYQRSQESGTFRELKTRLAYFYSQDRSHFGILEGLITFGLDESLESPTLSLAAYGSLQPETQALSFNSQNGFVHGQGLGASLDAGIFSGAFGFNHRYGAFLSSATEERSALTFALTLAPEYFLFRGAYSWINQSVTADSENEPAVASSEHHFEVSAGFTPGDSFLLAAGYRGVRGENYSSNQIFLGLQSSFSGSIPFEQAMD